jgi:hypothetical protein
MPDVPDGTRPALLSAHTGDSNGELPATERHKPKEGEQPMNTIEGKARSSKSRRVAFGLVLVAGFAAQSISSSPGVALADGGRGDHGSIDVTFTKWFVNSTGAMAGVVAGDVGTGAFAGQVLSADSTSEPGFLLLHARYEFHGSKHTFIADIQARENDGINPPTATVDGIVTSGFKNGASVTGSFTLYTTCPVATPGNVNGSLCFQGNLHLRPSEAEADATFTKWFVSPTLLMAGVVGGDVGTGIYAGQVLSVDSTSQPGFLLIRARYEFHGAKHTFIADMHIVENDTITPARAALTGIVTSGWLTGAQVTGRYTVMNPCPIATPGNITSQCFQGILHVEFGGDND